MNKQETLNLIENWVNLELSTLKLFEIFNLNYLNTKTKKILHKDTLKKYLRDYLEEEYHFNREWLKEQFKERHYNKIISTKSSPEFQARKHSIYLKGLKTKLENGTVNTSKPEEEVKEKLIALYGEADVEVQYSSPRYPFACDFYIKSKDLFIECDFHWTHDNHRYDPNNEKDVIKMMHFFEKAKAGSGFYRRALETWTISDPLKYWYQTSNRLNFLRFYNEKEFNTWYDAN